VIAAQARQPVVAGEELAAGGRHAPKGHRKLATNFGLGDTRCGVVRAQAVRSQRIFLASISLISRCLGTGAIHGEGARNHIPQVF
jgi:hypothetical protein